MVRFLDDFNPVFKPWPEYQSKNVQKWMIKTVNSIPPFKLADSTHVKSMSSIRLEIEQRTFEIDK